MRFYKTFSNSVLKLFLSKFISSLVTYNFKFILMNIRLHSTLLVILKHDWSIERTINRCSETEINTTTNGSGFY